MIGLLNINPEAAWRWSGDNENAFDCVEDDILHDKKNLKVTVPNNPLLLAFTESVGGIYNA
jgi:hypothetical protein